MNALFIAAAACGSLVHAEITGTATRIPNGNLVTGPACLALGDTYTVEIYGQTDPDGRLLSGLATGLINGVHDGVADWSDQIAADAPFPPVGNTGNMRVRYERRAGGIAHVGFANPSLVDWSWRTDAVGPGLCYAEVTSMVWDITEYYAGDANSDGKFNSTDLVKVFTAGEYEDDPIANSTWVTGDWDGNQEFDSSDIVVAMLGGRYELPTAAYAIPEPSALLLLAVGIGLTTFRHRGSLAERRIRGRLPS